MCDNDFVLVDVPKQQLDLVVAAWADFKRAPSDQTKFDSFDWMLRVAMAKWEAYSLNRRVAACGDG